MSETRRRFNGRERVALYLAADGRCEDCGAELEPGWHADHRQPYSRGGPTDVINGQALCPTCNLRKGDTYMELRAWQSDALDLFLRNDDDYLAVATPGAGKTTFALVAAQRLIERTQIRRIVVVVPTSHLRGQWAQAGARLGIQLDHRFVNSSGVVARDFDGVVVTYAAVASNALLWRRLASSGPTLVILDEIHHCGEHDKLAWGEALKTAFEPAARRLLLSGTPFRSDGAAIPFVPYDDDRPPRCVPTFDYDYGKALLDQEVVRPIEFIALDGDVRWRNAGAVTQTTLANADDETLANALRSALLPDGPWITSALKRANEELTRQRLDVPDAGGLVIAADQDRARAYAALLKRITGEDVTIAISDEPDASERIEEFRRGSSRWIVAVQMVSEGVDIPRLSVGVYASRTRTEMFFRQVVGRFVRMRGAEDETYAALFVPSIKPLLDYAQTIEHAVNRALAQEEQEVRTRIKDQQSSTPLQFDLVEPMTPSDARHHSTILSGDSFTDEELRRADAAARAAGMPASVTPARAAAFLRMAGAGRVVGTAVVQPEATRPLADEKAELRRLIKRKVGLLHHRTDAPHSHIHGDLNRQCGDRINTATVETLEQRLTLLDHWLGMA